MFPVMFPICLIAETLSPSWKAKTSNDRKAQTVGRHLGAMLNGWLDLHTLHTAMECAGDTGKIVSALTTAK